MTELEQVVDHVQNVPTETLRQIGRNIGYTAELHEGSADRVHMLDVATMIKAIADWRENNGN